MAYRLSNCDVGDSKNIVYDTGLVTRSSNINDIYKSLNKAIKMSKAEINDMQNYQETE